MDDLHAGDSSLMDRDPGLPLLPLPDHCVLLPWSASVGWQSQPDAGPPVVPVSADLSR